MSSYSLGRLKSHTGSQAALSGQAQKGLQRIGLGDTRDGLLYVPKIQTPDHAAPLLVMLHGAGGHAHHALVPVQDFADHTGMVILAPESRGATWDVILDDFGPDVRFIDAAIDRVLSRFPIDPKRIAIAGFSDGASYALSLGIINGDYFTDVIAFSPGFVAAQDFFGSPKIFVSHGISDQVLRIDNCSRRIVPRLKQAGYRVDYREFDGGHTIPIDIARDAMTWFLGRELRSQVAESDVPVKESGIEST